MKLMFKVTEQFVVKDIYNWCNCNQFGCLKCEELNLKHSILNSISLVGLVQKHKG